MQEIYIETIAVNPAPSFQDISEMSQVLRGEIAATEAYELVMERIGDGREYDRLRELLQDHREAVAYWEQEVHSEGVVPDHTSGPWGKVVEGFVAAARIFGSRAALKVLKEGEEHGLEEYKQMLASRFVSPVHKRYIREVLIPNQESHITGLDEIMSMH